MNPWKVADAVDAPLEGGVGIATELRVRACEGGWAR